MIGAWTLRDEDERSSLAYLIANAPADGRYLVTITEAAMTTDDLFQPLQATPPWVLQDCEALRTENAELRRRLADWERKSAELSAKVSALLQRLDEGDMPL